jgi:hypothetical protein
MPSDTASPCTRYLETATAPLVTSSTQSVLSKLRRVDFLAAIFLSLSIVSGLLVLDLCGQRMPWTDPKMLLLLGASVIALNVFVFVEAAWAKEPIFPLRLLLNRDVITSYVNMGFQTGAQGAVSLGKEYVWNIVNFLF